MAKKAETAADQLVREEADREEAIRRRAHEISESGDAGTPEENWLRAERELGADSENREADPSQR